MERTREVYRACLKLIPHKAFTFAKVQPSFVSQGICPSAFTAFVCVASGSCQCRHSLHDGASADDALGEWACNKDI